MSGMIADRLDGVLPAVHHLEHARREPGLGKQLGDATGADRHQLRRLQDHAVAQGDRVRDRPVGHHVRKVERRDRRDDAERKALDAALDAAAHLEHFARRDLRQRARELGQLGGLQHFGARFARDLAVFFGDERRELVDVRFQKSLVSIKDLHPLLDRRRRPGRKGGARCLHGGVDLGGFGERDLRDDVAAARVVDVEKRARLRRRDKSAADVVLELSVFHSAMMRGGPGSGKAVRRSPSSERPLSSRAQRGICTSRLPPIARYPRPKAPAAPR